MKQYLTFMRVMVVFLIIACYGANSKAIGQTTNNVAQKNLLAANAINKAIATGDVSNLGDFIALDAVDHSREHGDMKGLDLIKAGLSPVHALAANDMKFEVMKELADSEYVFQWLRVTGTATTADLDVAVGSKFSLPIVNVTKFKNGKAVEHWEFLQR